MSYPDDYNSGAQRQGGGLNMGQALDVFPAHHFTQDAAPLSDYDLRHSDQLKWQSNPPATYHASPNQLAPDTQYQEQYPNYQTYLTIPLKHHSPRTLPPFGVHEGQFRNQPTISSQPMGQSSAAGYPGQYSPYPSEQFPLWQPFHGLPLDSRAVVPAAFAVPYDPPGVAGIPHHPSKSVHQTVKPPMPPGHGMAPYLLPQLSLYSEYDRRSVAVDEPTVKQKRKRADAEQLKVLNETYNRTAFPSTEERTELAKKLGMSARAVQIWFQNKRQAARQSTRQVTAIPPSAVGSFATGPAPGASSLVSARSPHTPRHGGVYGGGSLENSIAMGSSNYMVPSIIMASNVYNPCRHPPHLVTVAPTHVAYPPSPHTVATVPAMPYETSHGVPVHAPYDAAQYDIPAAAASSSYGYTPSSTQYADWHAQPARAAGPGPLPRYMSFEGQQLTSDAENIAGPLTDDPLLVAHGQQRQAMTYTAGHPYGNLRGHY